MNNKSDTIMDKAEAMSFVLHQDTLMWSRLQTMHAVQVAAIGGCYALRSVMLLSLGILVLGVILTILVFFMLKRDQMIRDKFLPTAGLDWTIPRKWYAPISGGTVSWLILTTLLATDIAFASSILFGLIK